MLERPFGDRVWDGAGEMQRGEGVETFDVATLPDAGDPVAVAGVMPFVGLFHGFFTDFVLGLSHTAG